jgi:hypothetical protein
MKENGDLNFYNKTELYSILIEMFERFGREKNKVTL